ncbi:hypothetical protein EV363DRAFT_1214611, partial [Boletus edulis]
MSWNAATSGCEFKVMPIDALECTSVTNISSLWFRRQRRHGFPLARHSLKAQARCSSCNISMSPPPTRSSSHGRIQPHPLCGRSFRDVHIRPYRFRLGILAAKGNTHPNCREQGIFPRTTGQLCFCPLPQERWEGS